MPEREDSEGNSYYELEKVEGADPCPFCNSVLLYHDHEMGLAFTCLFCNYTIVFDCTEIEEALKIWNNRPRERRLDDNDSRNEPAGDNQ